MRELIAARSWLTVHQLPPYAPEPDPVAGVWPNLKRSRANLTQHGPEPGNDQGPVVLVELRPPG